MPSTINNEASVTYQFIDASETNTITSNEQQITLEDGQGLTLTKTGSPSEFVAGEIITYSIDITNNSSSNLTGVRIIDNLGGGNLAYVVGSATLTTSSLTYSVSPVATNPLTFTLQQLNVGATMTLTYRCQVVFNLPSNVNVITNSVQGIGYTNTSTITGFANFTIRRANGGDFSITKGASESVVFPKQVFSYRITLSNGSGVDARAISIVDQLPSNFIVTSVSLRMGQQNPVQLLLSDYLVTGTNLLTISSVMSQTLTVAAGSLITVFVTGYFN